MNRQKWGKKYVHNLSNYPLQFIRESPVSVKDRLCKKSSDEGILESTELEYQEVFRKSGRIDS